MRLRNPFPMIFKVLKHDFIHLSKTFIPLYSVLVLFGFVNCIVLSNKEHIFKTPDNSFIYALLIMVSVWLLLGIYIASIVIISKRFSKGMLKDEAYMNLSLPVTIGEHLWGRILSAFVWLQICTIVSIVSVGLALVPFYYEIPLTEEDWNQIIRVIPRLFGTNWAFLITFSILSAIVHSIAFISFLFCISTAGNFVKKHKTLIVIILAVVLLSISSKISTNITSACIIKDASFDESLLFHENANQIFRFKEFIFYSGLLSILEIGATLGITHLIFAKKLDLD